MSYWEEFLDSMSPTWKTGKGRSVSIQPRNWQNFLISLLEENKKFKKSIINESPGEVDLKSMTRCYIESLSRAHDAARDLIKESVQNARQNFEDAYSQYRKICADHLGSLSACIIDDQGNQGIIETVPLMLYLDDIRMKLQKRNRKLVNLKKSYVTGKAKAS